MEKKDTGRVIKFRAWHDARKQMAEIGAIDWDAAGGIFSAHLSFGAGKNGTVIKINPDLSRGRGR